MIKLDYVHKKIRCLKTSDVYLIASVRELVVSNTLTYQYKLIKVNDTSIFDNWFENYLESMILYKKYEWIDSEPFNTCNHKYEQYIGFTQAYNYCTKCDQKEVK